MRTQRCSFWSAPLTIRADVHGRKEELGELSDFCLKHNLILLLMKYMPTSWLRALRIPVLFSLPGAIQDRLVYASSLTKTFNIPGLIISYMVIPNEELRKGKKDTIDRIGMHNPNIFSVVAVEAGYRQMR